MTLQNISSFFSSRTIVREREYGVVDEFYCIKEIVGLILDYMESVEVDSPIVQQAIYTEMITLERSAKYVSNCKDPELKKTYQTNMRARFERQCKTCASLFSEMFNGVKETREMVEALFDEVTRKVQEIANIRKSRWGYEFVWDKIVDTIHNSTPLHDDEEGRFEIEVEDKKKKLSERIEDLRTKIFKQAFTLANKDFTCEGTEQSDEKSAIWKGCQIKIDGWCDRQYRPGIKLRINIASEGKEDVAVMKLIRHGKVIILDQIDTSSSVDGTDEEYLAESVVYHIAAEVLMQQKDPEMIVQISDDTTFKLNAHDFVAAKHHFLPPNEQVLSSFGANRPYSWRLSREEAQSLLEGKPRFFAIDVGKEGSATVQVLYDGDPDKILP